MKEIRHSIQKPSFDRCTFRSQLQTRFRIHDCSAIEVFQRESSTSTIGTRTTITERKVTCIHQCKFRNRTYSKDS